MGYKSNMGNPEGYRNEVHRKMAARGIKFTDNNEELITLVADAILSPCRCEKFFYYKEPDNSFGGFMWKKSCLDCGEIYLHGKAK